MNRILTSYFFFALPLFLGLSSCRPESNPDMPLNTPLFTAVSPEKSGLTFSNTLTENEIHNVFRYEYFYNGGGVSVGDFNNDGLQDLYFTGNSVSDKLYLNKGNLVFEDITDKAIKTGQEGWHTGTTLADVNADGFLDIYVCRSGDINDKLLTANLLYINNGDLTFTESAQEYGLADTLLSTQAAFFDLDLDGDLDAYVVNTPPKPFSLNSEEFKQLYISHQNKTDHFYLNNGGKFEEASYKTGINNHAFGLGISVGDLTNDGYPDLYIANDYEEADMMFINRNGFLSEEVKLRTGHTSFFGMGTDIADFNNDGELDILELDMAYASHVKSKRNMESMSSQRFWDNVLRGNHYQYMVNTLQLNNGNGTFSEIGQLAGVAKTDWSWGCLFADLDNDGLKDIVISNGQRRELKDRDFKADLGKKIKNKEPITLEQVLASAPVSKVSNFLFRNNGNLTFENTTEAWGLNRGLNSNGLAFADLDNDGDLDLVFNNLDETCSLYENQQNGRENYLTISLKGKQPNSMAIGARVTIYLGEQKQVVELFPTRGYLSSQDYRLHFGLGKAKIVDKIEIRWPDLKITVLNGVSTNQILEIDYANSSFSQLNQKAVTPLFVDASDSLKIDYRHVENQFSDFKREILLPHALSTQGPCMAVADLNKDGLEDLFMGGAKEFPGQLFFQQPDGSFEKQKISAFEIDRLSEDLGALFLDVDNDNDLDLYVCSGGNDCEFDAPALQDRLYLNDGFGKFRLANSALPRMISSTKAVAAGDIDGDGDLDLFVGGRLLPGQYPFPSRSYLLKNEKGRFTDVTESYCLDMLHPGMVTGADFQDINGDGKPDLVLVGEAMGFTTFINKADQFEKLEAAPSTHGMWFSLRAADLDQDGDIDFVAGNMGKNTKFKGSVAKPFNIYGHDFDENGSVDIVLSAYEGETNYPVRGKECSSQQMPFLLEKYPTYKEFAEADMGKIYGEKLSQALHLTVTDFQSSFFLNDGKGNFEMRHLPIEAQFAPVMGIEAEDINLDGNLDLLLVGNLFDAEVETVRYDAGRGLCLLGDGKGDFKALSPKESGFFLRDHARTISRINIVGKPTWLIGVNNGQPKAFSRF